jgi:hypothetical protein
LRDLPVTVSVGPLSPAEIEAALAGGLARAAGFRRRGLIAGACLMLAGQSRVLEGLSRTEPASFPRSVSASGNQAARGPVAAGSPLSASLGGDDERRVLRVD